MNRADNRLLAIPSGYGTWVRRWVRWSELGEAIPNAQPWRPTPAGPPGRQGIWPPEP